MFCISFCPRPPVLEHVTGSSENNDNHHVSPSLLPLLLQSQTQLHLRTRLQPRKQELVCCSAPSHTHVRRRPADRGDGRRQTHPWDNGHRARSCRRRRTLMSSGRQSARTDRGQSRSNTNTSVVGNYKKKSDVNTNHRQETDKIVND